ncbi:MAG: LPD1 domain-containing protein [Bacteroidota bacterium]
MPKYEDIGDFEGSRKARHWDREMIIPYFLLFRKGGKPIPQSYKFWDHRFLMDYWHLKGWEFGNWTTQEDRLNYVCAMGIGLYDLKQILGFPKEFIGLKGMMGLAIGARGKGRALAHFEPWSWNINITRYQAYGDSKGKMKLPIPDNPKLRHFLYTGGVGSFAHEYGHALDYWFGAYYDHGLTVALSAGDSLRTRTKRELLSKKTLRGITEKILDAIIWEKPGVYTSYYTTLKQRTRGEYWIRRNEIFARAFEQYITYKMAQQKMVNSFLSKEKYSSLVYMDPRLLKKVAPIFDQLITAMKRYIKTKK